jgi:predicted transcriptional regulator
VQRRFRLWGFQSPDELLDNSLGALEREVMRVAWDADEITVRDACVALGPAIAYTTVMTTMDRLYKKGFLGRRKVGRAFVYRAAATRRQIEGAVAGQLVEHLLQNHESEPLPILSRLVDVVTERDRALLGDLERLVREKRRELDRRKEE